MRRQMIVSVGSLTVACLIIIPVNLLYNRGFCHIFVILKRRTFSEDNIFDMGNSVRLNVVNLSSPVNFKFECVFHKGSLPFVQICLHEQSDKYISPTIRGQRALEDEVVVSLVKELTGAISMGLIDIGANIGYVSLKIAKLGYLVVAVEPMFANFNRFHKSIQLNNLTDRITLITNPISNVRQNILLKYNPSNPGDSRTLLREALVSDVMKCKNICPEDTAIGKSVMLNDLLEVLPFNRAVIKLDVQAHEHRVLQRAAHFLSKIDVTLIVCEWVLVKRFYGQRNEEEAIVLDAIHLLMSLHYRPYGNSSYESELNITTWNNWPYDVLWKKKIL